MAARLGHDSPFGLSVGKVLLGIRLFSLFSPFSCFLPPVFFSSHFACCFLLSLFSLLLFLLLLGCQNSNKFVYFSLHWPPASSRPRRDARSVNNARGSPTPPRVRGCSPGPPTGIYGAKLLHVAFAYPVGAAGAGALEGHFCSFFAIFRIFGVLLGLLKSTWLF